MEPEPEPDDTNTNSNSIIHINNNDNNNKKNNINPMKNATEQGPSPTLSRPPKVRFSTFTVFDTQQTKPHAVNYRSSNNTNTDNNSNDYPKQQPNNNNSNIGDEDIESQPQSPTQRTPRLQVML